MDSPRPYKIVTMWFGEKKWGPLPLFEEMGLRKAEFLKEAGAKLVLSEIADNEPFQIQTTQGGINVVRPEGEYVYSVFNSDLEEVEKGDRIQLNGVLLGDSSVYDNVVAKGYPLAYSRMTKTKLDNGEVFDHWDRVHRSTPPVRQIFLVVNGGISPVFAKGRS
jgi:hypothetical protein